MRKIITISMIAAAAFAVAACDSPPAPPPLNSYDGDTSNFTVDENEDVNECPRRDGQPCK